MEGCKKGKKKEMKAGWGSRERGLIPQGLAIAPETCHHQPSLGLSPHRSALASRPQAFNSVNEHGQAFTCRGLSHG